MRSCLLFLALLTAPLARSVAAEGLVLLPSECVLSTPESTQALLLQRTAGGGLRQQVIQKVVWSSSDPGVATVESGMVRPVADGEALITASLGASSATTKVV